MDLDLIVNRIVGMIPLIIALTVHEWAHAWTALKLGDDTAKRMGRVTLNPFEHIDPIGTFLLPLLGVPFGWAKPVPIDATRFRPTVNPAMGVVITALAGPLSNVILGIISCVLLAIVVHGIPSEMLSFSVREMTQSFLGRFILTNTVLACFNMLPIPPLDGSRIADGLMPVALRPMWRQFCQLGPMLLIAVIMVPRANGFSLFEWPLSGAEAIIDWIMHSR